MLPRKSLPDRALVARLLRYDATTGLLTWMPRPRKAFTSNATFVMWNRRYAGTIGGTAWDGHHHVISLDDVQHKLHRIVWLLVRGEPVPDIIDHIDMDTRNNRIENLRAATAAQSGWNTRRVRTNTSGVKGVFFNRFKGCFVVMIRCDGKRHRIGQFKTLAEAVSARHEAATRLHGEFTRHG